MNTKLVLISRFNLPYRVWADRTEDDYRDWIRDRINLFRDLTARSVRNCYEKPDVWLIFVDNRVVNVNDELTEITKGLPVKLVEYSGIPLPVAIQKALSNFSYPARIITCRLDTDDLVASGIFRAFRGGAQKATTQEAQDGTVLSCAGGAIYDASRDTFFFSNYPDNPFLGLLEEVAAPEDLRTVFMSQHPDLISNNEHVQALRSFGPLWASVVHGDNVANQSLLNTARFAFADTKQLKNAFGIESYDPNVETPEK
jgi:hypothetical protein